MMNIYWAENAVYPEEGGVVIVAKDINDALQRSLKPLGFESLERSTINVYPLETATGGIREHLEELDAAMRAAVAAEREACAAIADDHARERRERMQKSNASWLEERAIAAEDIAAEIRARSKDGVK